MQRSSASGPSCSRGRLRTPMVAFSRRRSTGSASRSYTGRRLGTTGSGSVRCWDRPSIGRPSSWPPEGALVLPNRHGTAPGLVWHEGGRLLVVLPGPPREVRPLFTEEVLPIILKGTG